MVPTAEGALRLASRACSEPHASVAEWKALTGRKSAGCTPGHIPSEIVHAAGMLPIVLWGDEAHPSDLRATIDAWFHPPAGNAGSVDSTDEALLDRIEELQEEAGRVSGRIPSEGALERSVRAYNEIRRRYRLLAERLAETPGIFSAVDIHLIACSGMTLPAETCAEILAGAISRKAGAVRGGGKRVFLAGGMSTGRLMNALDGFRAVIVGEDLSRGSRFHSAQVEESGDVALSLAHAHGKLRSAIGVDPGEEGALAALFRNVEETRAERLVVIGSHRFDPFEGNTPALRSESERRGIPLMILPAGSFSGGNIAHLEQKLREFLEHGKAGWQVSRGENS